MNLETTKAKGAIASFQEGQVWINDDKIGQFQVDSDEKKRKLVQIIKDGGKVVLGYSWIAGDEAHGVWELPEGADLSFLVDVS